MSLGGTTGKSTGGKPDVTIQIEIILDNYLWKRNLL